MILADKTIIFVIFVFVNDEEGIKNFGDDKFRSRYQKGDTRGAAIIFRRKREIVLVDGKMRKRSSFGKHIPKTVASYMVMRRQK